MVLLWECVYKFKHISPYFSVGEQFLSSSLFISTIQRKAKWLFRHSNFLDNCETWFIICIQVIKNNILDCVQVVMRYTRWVLEKL